MLLGELVLLSVEASAESSLPADFGREKRFRLRDALLIIKGEPKRPVPGPVDELEPAAGLPEVSGFLMLLIVVAFCNWRW